MVDQHDPLERRVEDPDLRGQRLQLGRAARVSRQCVAQPRPCPVELQHGGVGIADSRLERIFYHRGSLRPRCDSSAERGHSDGGDGQ